MHAVVVTKNRRHEGRGERPVAALGKDRRAQEGVEVRDERDEPLLREVRGCGERVTQRPLLQDEGPLEAVDARQRRRMLPLPQARVPLRVLWFVATYD